jgi:hypothetical protein
VIQLQLRQQGFDLQVGHRLAGGIQNIRKQKAIAENARKKMPVVRERVGDRLLIDQYLAAVTMQQSTQ